MSLWRRSLGLRVAVSTLLASSAVVGVVAVLLLQQVTHGVVQAKTRAALAQSRTLLDDAQDQARVTDPTDTAAVDRLLDALATSPARRTGPAGQYNVVIVGLAGSPGRSTDHVLPSSIPDSLRARVAGGYRAWAYGRLRYDDGRPSLPGVVVGDTLPVGGTPGFALFCLYPLDQEQRTAGLVQRTLAFAAVALVALLVLIAGLVTRQVVLPVRQAARTAQRLASGDLEQRLASRREDDIGRLALSFNEMAGALQRQIRRLEELSRMQRRFVSDVSHELRTPLTTIRMATDVLHDRRGRFDPETARAAELLESQIDRFESLLVDLLEISRHDAGAAVLDAEPTDVRLVVQRAVEANEPLARRRGCQVRVVLPDEPLVAQVDPRRVERILRNLLENAVEHGEGRPLVVRAAGTPDAVALTVRDHGVGLRPGDASLVFQRFWRADAARARTTGGTGLGLAIALEDARLHGGWLQAVGEPGSGSMFRLTLPRSARGSLTDSPLPLDLDPGPADGLVPEPAPASDARPLGSRA